MTEPIQPTPQLSTSQILLDQLTLLRGEVKQLKEHQISAKDLNAFDAEFRKLANYTNATSKKTMDEFNATAGGFIRSHSQEMSQAFDASNAAVAEAMERLMANISASMDERLQKIGEATNQAQMATKKAEGTTKWVDNSLKERLLKAEESAQGARRTQFRWFGAVCALMLVIGALGGAYWTKKPPRFKFEETITDEFDTKTCVAAGGIVINQQGGSRFCAAWYKQIGPSQEDNISGE